MKLLGIDSTAKSASAAICEDGKILALQYSNTGYTHSVTLMPMVKNVLCAASLKIDDIDAFAVTAGPGSFTGVRIGVACVKGMAQPLGKPCIAVSTLEAAAKPLEAFDCYAVAVMDARCKQVYAAEFECKNGALIRKCPDCAVSISELADRLKSVSLPIILAGDGASLCYGELSGLIPGLRLAPEQIRFQSAAAVALIAEQKLNNGETLTCDELTPVYLRVPQAVREKNAREAHTQTI